MKYTTYLLTSKTSGKQYVGYSSKGVSARLHKHHINAKRGQQTHLYNAIRLYGIDDFSSKILWEGRSKKKATDMEKFYIKNLDTYVNGYNQSLGGDGGYCVPPEKRDEFYKNHSRMMKGTNNPRYINVDDETLLEGAYSYFKEHGVLPLYHWFIYSKTLGFPTSYALCRFEDLGGGRVGFKNSMKKNMGCVTMTLNM